jgi:hypothetical protein
MGTRGGRCHGRCPRRWGRLWGGREPRRGQPHRIIDTTEDPTLHRVRMALGWHEGLRALDPRKLFRVHTDDHHQLCGTDSDNLLRHGPRQRGAPERRAQHTGEVGSLRHTLRLERVRLDRPGPNLALHRASRRGVDLDRLQLPYARGLCGRRPCRRAPASLEIRLHPTGGRRSRHRRRGRKLDDPPSAGIRRPRARARLPDHRIMRCRHLDGDSHRGERHAMGRRGRRGLPHRAVHDARHRAFVGHGSSTEAAPRGRLQPQLPHLPDHSQLHAHRPSRPRGGGSWQLHNRAPCAVLPHGRLQDSCRRGGHPRPELPRGAARVGSRFLRFPPSLRDDHDNERLATASLGGPHLDRWRALLVEGPREWPSSPSAVASVRVEKLVPHDNRGNVQRRGTALDERRGEHPTGVLLDDGSVRSSGSHQRPGSACADRHVRHGFGDTDRDQRNQVGAALPVSTV